MQYLKNNNARSLQALRFALSALGGLAIPNPSLPLEIIAKKLDGKKIFPYFCQRGLKNPFSFRKSWLFLAAELPCVHKGVFTFGRLPRDSYFEGANAFRQRNPHTISTN